MPAKICIWINSVCLAKWTCRQLAEDAVLLGAASLGKVPGRRAEYIVGRKGRQISWAKRVHQKEKSGNSTWQRICLCGLGEKWKTRILPEKRERKKVESQFKENTELSLKK